MDVGLVDHDLSSVRHGLASFLEDREMYVAITCLLFKSGVGVFFSLDELSEAKVRQLFLKSITALFLSRKSCPSITS